MQLKGNFQIFFIQRTHLKIRFGSLARQAMWSVGWEEQQDRNSEDKSPSFSTSNYPFDVA